MATLSSLNINNRITRTPIDTSSVPLESVIEKMHHNKQHTSLASPDRDAMEFYALNHLIADMQVKGGNHYKLSQDEEKLVTLYFDVINGQARRMFYYLLAICTRESRHAKSGPDLHKKFGERNGPLLDKFKDNVNVTDSGGAVAQLLSNHPDVNLGTYVEYLEFLFFEYGFSSSGYGGDKWGEVAKVLRKCVYGEMSLELMVDCAFNLSHNNGPIFNKGMWYHNYQNNFIKILDVQRSGQMPTFLKTQSLYTTTVVMDTIIDLGPKINPELFGEYVCWYTVEANGSVKQYDSEKHAQKENHSVAKKYLGNIFKKQNIEGVVVTQDKKDLHLGFAAFTSVKMQRSM